MLSVVIIVVDEYELSRQCIESVQAYTTGDFEIVVVDKHLVLEHIPMLFLPRNQTSSLVCKKNLRLKAKGLLKIKPTTFSIQ